MTNDRMAIEEINVDRVHLSETNPRHKPLKGQPETIAHLCRDEQVLTLAQDIASIGLNPLDLFALIPDKGGNTYLVAEGNRRFCALILLNDPDRAPSDQKERFRKAAQNWTPITAIPAVVFNEWDDVRVWLDRIHGGPDGGRGRKSWDAEQKARNTTYRKNDFSQAVLDEAERRGYISESERKGRISTVQKYLANPRLREAIGLDSINPENLTTDLSEDDFAKVFKAFIRDVADKKIDTRTGRKADYIRDYARTLESRIPTSGQRIASRPLGSGEAPQPKRPRSTKPSQPTPRDRVPHNQELDAAIRAIPSYKLEHLYWSLTSLPLGDHTPLLYVAAWSLIESLTRRHGSETDFQSYLSILRLGQLGFPKGDAQSSIRDALARISRYGNSTKHDHTAAAFNGEQLANDIEVLTPVMIKLAESAD